MQYSEKVLDHFTHPRNVGEIEDANGVGEVGNAKCGDIMKIYLKVSDDGIIEDVKFKTFGCGAAIATSSMATEMVKGKSLEEALKLTNKAVAEALDGLPPVKMHCSVLAEEALRSAISDYYKRLGKDPAEILGCDADYLHNEGDDFIAMAGQQYGYRGKKGAERLLKEVRVAFSGGEMAEEDMDEMMLAIQEAYIDAKKRNKKYTPQKYLKQQEGTK